MEELGICNLSQFFNLLMSIVADSRLLLKVIKLLLKLNWLMEVNCLKYWLEISRRCYYTLSKSEVSNIRSDQKSWELLNFLEIWRAIHQREWYLVLWWWYLARKFRFLWANLLEFHDYLLLSFLHSLLVEFLHLHLE